MPNPKFKVGDIVFNAAFPSNHYRVGRVHKMLSMYTLQYLDKKTANGRAARYGYLPFDEESRWSIVKEKVDGE